MRLDVFRGEFHWHDDDKFFYVVDGHLSIEVENAPTIELDPKQGVTIPRGAMRRPLAPDGAVILMVEGDGPTPTGD